MTALLHELVTREAQRRPGAIALVAGTETMTYGRLDDLSSRLARVLIDRGVERGSRVGVMIPKSPAAIVSILGILKAGGAYVPLDPDNPPARTERMLRSSDDRFLLTTSRSADALADLLSTPPSSGQWCVGWMDAADRSAGLGAAVPGESFGLDEVSAAQRFVTAPSGDPNDLAYIMFTSGSTGVPKGVMITHANVMAFVDWAVPYFGIAGDDRTSSHPPLHFDLSVFDLFGSFGAGAAVHLVPKSLNLLPGALARLIRDSELTQWFSVPSVLNQMMTADCVTQGDFPKLRRLLWCGEVLPTPTLRWLMTRLPHVSFTNLYGPTEATIASSYHTVTQPPAHDRQDIPIGRACAGEELLVLDEALSPVPTGETGELYLAGVGLSPGYWRDEEKTASAFREIAVDGDAKRIYRTGDLAWRDADGLVHYVGRSDTQIKSRGYRIELGEIEAALRSLPEISEAAVVAVSSGGFEGLAICAAYALSAPGSLTSDGITHRLRALLPSYMLPHLWAEYPRLPTNSSGKVDRVALKSAFATGARVGA